MKKISTLLILAILFVACKTNTATKLDNKAEVAIKGNWSIFSVTYPGQEVIKVTSFDLADSQCLVGSNWSFVSNNNKGQMSLTKSDCPAFSSPITWFINKDGNFVFKILSTGEKSKKVKEGYVLKVANQTENSFQLIDKINVGGKSTDVVYQFQKSN
jgi:hypothetical protein